MALLTESWLYDILGILTALIAVAVVAINRSYKYWSKRGVETAPPKFFFGNVKDLLTQTDTFAMFIKHYYDYIKKDRRLPHGGFYFMISPIYMPTDPAIIKNIMQNDFDHFVDRGTYSNEKKDPLSAHLFSLEGAKWRNLRLKLTPTFTSGKMKMMFETLVKCGDQLTTEMDRQMGKGPADIKDVLIRFTTDIIGNCAFGIECNSLKDPDNEFSKYGRLFFKDSLWDNIEGFFTLVAPNIARSLGVTQNKPPLSTFFMSMIKQTVDYREKNNIHRKDFMHLLLQLKNRGKLDDDGSIRGDETTTISAEEKFTFNELAAQAFVFFLAGFETSSTTMTFCLYELASNQEIQERARQEVNKVLEKYGGQLSYDAVMEMNYMERVINEALRKYPPLPIHLRVCNKEYRIPDTDVVLEKGSRVFIPILGLQRDEEYYPDPDKFDPERFTEEIKAQRHPFTFLPFGEGPRICIGLRFGMMQAKVGLSVLLRKYRFSVNSKTIEPLQFDPTSFIMSTKGGIWLDYVPV